MMQDKGAAVRQAHMLLDAVCAQYHTDQVYAAFSGGHDSLAAAHVASTHRYFRGVVHIDTTIGIPETRSFVEQTCKDRGWPIHVSRPGRVNEYTSLVLAFGFPGPAQHQMMYHQLKQRPLSSLLTKLRMRPGQNIVLATGMRRQESARRMALTTNVKVDKNIIWVSHIFGWNSLDVSSYVNEEGLKRNQVKDTLHISGECLCGCFADTHERQDIATWYPGTHRRLTNLEMLIQEAHRLEIPGCNFPADRRRWGWGAGNELSQGDYPDALPMCHFCTADRETALEGV